MKNSFGRKKLLTFTLNEGDLELFLGTSYEGSQVISRVWAHILLIGRTHSVDKNPKSIRAISLFLGRYRVFSEFSL